MNHDDDRPVPGTGRREFLAGSGALLGASWLAANFPLVARAAEAAHAARQSAAAFVNLGVDEAADIEAVAARIVPTDDTPGATEAGVVWFIDQALGGFLAGEAATLRAGLAELNGFVAEHTGRARFALLEAAAQDEILAARQETPFFESLRFLTLAGIFTMPSYGGNRGHVGWELIGFEHRHVWVPPFGYYDAQPADGDENHG